MPSGRYPIRTSASRRCAPSSSQANMLRIVGPDYVPELYDHYVDGGSGATVLAMEIADSHAELSRFCTRCGRTWSEWPSL